MSTQDYSDWRALHQGRAPFGKQLAAARVITHPDLRVVAVRETWRMMDVAQVAKEATWQGDCTSDYLSGHYTLPLTSYDEEYWRVSHAACVLADQDTLDLVPVAHRWSTVPGRAWLPHWEDWARVHAHEHLDAPRRAIEAKEAWCQGERNDLALDAAARAAESAESLAWRNGANEAAARAARAAAACARTQKRAATVAAHAVMDDYSAQIAFAACALGAIREVHLGA